MALYKSVYYYYYYYYLTTRLSFACIFLHGKGIFKIHKIRLLSLWLKPHVGPWVLRILHTAFI